MATKLSISKEKTAELIKEFGKSDNDSGSAEVQVAILSERIRNLTEHLKSPQEGQSPHSSWPDEAHR